jgi:hypothetical protein
MEKQNSKKAFVLPSDKAGQQNVQKDVIGQREARIRQILNTTFKGPEGVAALRYIMGLCGYQVTSLVIDPQTLDINPKSMIWNEAKRQMYVDHIRPFLDEELLIEAEIKKGDRV